MTRARVGLALLSLVVLVTAQGCSLGSIAPMVRGAAWQGLPAVLLGLSCATGGPVGDGAPCGELVAHIARIFEGDGEPDYELAAVAVPVSCSDELRTTPIGSQLEVELSTPTLEGATVKRIRTHGNPPDKWMETIQRASRRFHTEQAEANDTEADAGGV